VSAAAPHPPLSRHGDFRLLLVGQTTSQLGSQLAGVAVPLLAVVTLSATALEVGLINAASTVAFAVIGLPAGVWLDRVRRRPVLIAADLVRAGLLATIPALAAFGGLALWQLMAVSLLVGGARVFFDVGYRSYLPALIGPGQVLAGNSVLEFVRASGQVVGPGLGGILVAAWGAPWVIAVQALTFLVSSGCLIAIRRREPSVPADPERGPLARQIRVGLTFVLRSRVLRATAVASGVSNFAFALASAVNIIFMARVLGLPQAAIGIVIAAGSGTVMIGAALTPRLARRFGSARIAWLVLAVTMPLTVLGALAFPGWGIVLIVIGIAAGEFGQIVFSIANLSARQTISPPELLGRVNATIQVLVMGLFPLGALIGGGLGDLIGARLTLIVSGVLLLMAPLALRLGFGARTGRGGSAPGVAPGKAVATPGIRSHCAPHLRPRSCAHPAASCCRTALLRPLQRAQLRRMGTVAA
jgi:MFS family permease